MEGLIPKRQWIYAARVTGRFQRLHRASGTVLLLILFVAPWLSVGGHPLLLLDLEGRRLYALGDVFWAGETYYLVLIGLFLAFLLFFVTSLFGRIWCGFLCPQTVFLEEWVRRVELLIEGDRGKRMARDKGPWTFDKAWRKATKHLVFAVLALTLSMTLLSYFGGARQLWSGHGGPVEYGLVLAVGALWYADFAWFREQFCNYLCPYARFQSALVDRDTQLVAYDAHRGEPRKGTPGVTTLGACIDCNKCVAVCPAGIDIRKGFQLECINCARCIDACEGVMSKLGQPNLIQYTTLAVSEGEKTHWIRPRTVVYASLLSVLALGFVVLAATKHDIEAGIQRAPGSLYTEDQDGSVRNTYLLRVANLEPELDERDEDGKRAFEIVVEGLDGAELVTVPVRLAPEESITVPLVVRASAQALPRQATTSLRVHVRSHDDEIVLPATFKAPGV